MTEIAEAFSRHDFETTYPHLAGNVRWDIVGDRQLVGRGAVMSACDESAAFMSAVTTAFSTFRVSAGPDFVVIDSRARYATADGQASTVASCDIYRFAGETLREITSYTVETA